jgi:hypothetical protein
MVGDDKAQQLSELCREREEGFEFYKSVFGGEYTSLVRFKNFPMSGVEIPEGELLGSTTAIGLERGLAIKPAEIGDDFNSSL